MVCVLTLVWKKEVKLVIPVIPVRNYAVLVIIKLSYDVYIFKFSDIGIKHNENNSCTI